MKNTDRLHANLGSVRNLELTYNRQMRGEAELAVVYVGGRVKVFRVDRFLIEHLLGQLEDE
ncbi:MAG: hypothetical protein IN808_08570, partial [Rubrobacter sp.]|nr:hypothetical protein [Rubrobacter sp.]